MGCCTACAVKVKSGELRQVEALGVSQELRDAGYGLMCVAYPTADCELELADEDEVYELQFGRCARARGCVCCACALLYDCVWQRPTWGSACLRRATRSRARVLCRL